MGTRASSAEQDQWRFRFARDSALEGDGFEPSVPLQIRSRFRDLSPVPLLTGSRPGTGSSNPSPSSGESTANLASAPRAPHGGLDPLHGRNQGAVLRSGLANADTGREIFGRPWGSGHEGFLLPRFRPPRKRRRHAPDRRCSSAAALRDRRNRRLSLPAHDARHRRRCRCRQAGRGSRGAPRY